MCVRVFVAKQTGIFLTDADPIKHSAMAALSYDDDITLMTSNL